jgi:hypothetical protein
MKTYPEIHRGRGVPDSSGSMRSKPSKPLTFPDVCPVCNAAATTDGDYRGRKYACGGKYETKPQIQNHTEVWWGRCGA